MRRKRRRGSSEQARLAKTLAETTPQNVTRVRTGIARDRAALRLAELNVAKTNVASKTCTRIRTHGMMRRRRLEDSVDTSNSRMSRIASAADPRTRFPQSSPTKASVRCHRLRRSSVAKLAMRVVGERPTSGSDEGNSKRKTCPTTDFIVVLTHLRKRRRSPN